MSEERIRERTWTGSEDERREQGVCLPPTVPPNKTPRFTVPAGTKCRVTKVSPTNWISHVTKVNLEFDRYESCNGRFYVFRQAFYFLSVSCRLVKKREPS